ncbi:MAG TPA: enoyl-CoA hydratase-related protein [Acidimicrobiales bacterium]
MKGVDSTTVLWDLTADGVLTLTLNRPERSNAWNRELEMALHDLLEQAAESDQVRAVVITGSGRAFCPGLDTEDLARVSASAEGYDQSGRRPMVLPSLVPKPVICAINGGCAGLGLVTALFADVRFAADDAKITTAFARRGLPAEEAVAWILPRIVGHATALDLLLSGRVTMGSEAATIGLVHRALPRQDLLAAAHDYAADLARNCSPLAMATAKRQVYRDWERSLVEGRADARHLVGQVKSTSGDFAEGVRSYVEKRAPVFEPFGQAVDYSDYPPKGRR